MRPASRARRAGARVNPIGMRGLKRRCPRCDAAPNWRCTRLVGARTVPMQVIHEERKAEADGEDA